MGQSEVTDVMDPMDGFFQMILNLDVKARTQRLLGQHPMLIALSENINLKSHLF